MVPEKVAAFSRSAEVIARDTMEMHSVWIGQMQRVGMIQRRSSSLYPPAAIARA
jgi:hypothetical protein